MSIFLLLTIVLPMAGGEVVEELKGLITRGNRAYELSQRTRIRECADSAAKLVRVGKLAENDSLDYLASVYKLYGNYHYENCAPDSSAYYYDNALQLIASHPDIHFGSLTRLLLMRDKAQLEYSEGRYQVAADLLARVDTIIDYDQVYLPGDDNWLLTRMSYAITLARTGHINEALDMAKSELEGALDKESMAYGRAERMYAKILLLADADRRGALVAYKDYFQKQKREAMKHFGMMNAKQREDYWQRLRPFVTDCYQLESEAADFLYDVTLFAKGLLLNLTSKGGDGAANAVTLKTLGYTWRDIQKQLSAGQAAIEFIQYEKDGEQRMGALLVRNVGTPQFIPLTRPQEILNRYDKQISATERGSKDALYGDEELQTMVWTEQLLTGIKGVKRLYFAPDGYLHRLAIEYMPQVQNMELYRLTSTRRLMDRQGERSKSRGLRGESGEKGSALGSVDKIMGKQPTLFVGGVNYDLDKMPGEEPLNDVEAFKNYRGTWFPKLSDSSNEAKLIYDVRRVKGDTLVMASLASEKAFRELAPQYSSILVSTHGDFLSKSPAPTDLKGVDEDLTMSQNIIAFAGVNTYLQDSQFNAMNHSDGIMSAKELQGIDLRGCKLITLSACQSGLGEISSDGVYGLQRGLKNAGVGAMLLSLWNVNSEATAELMTSFYTGLSDGKSIHQAFMDARQSMLEVKEDMELNDGEKKEEKEYRFNAAKISRRPVKKRQPQKHDTPQYVNAFVLIDAI